MAAIRYCGSVTIRMTYRDATCDYACSVSYVDQKRVTVRVTVGEPAVITRAVDSSEAFDVVAHAAVSFADAEDRMIGQYAETKESIGSGWLITRKPQRSPVPVVTPA